MTDGTGFRHFFETELMRLGWKVDKRNWAVCPGVEIEEVPSNDLIIRGLYVLSSKDATQDIQKDRLRG